MDRNKDKDFEVTEGNIFADLGLDQPDELLIRAELLNRVSNLIKSSGLSQKEVAKRLGIRQPKVSQLINGCLSEFSTDSLLNYLALLGCGVDIRVKEPRSRKGIFHEKGYISVLRTTRKAVVTAAYRRSSRERKK